MKKRFKLSAVITSCLLLIALLAGCGQTAAPTGGGGAASDNNSGAAQTESPAAPEQPKSNVTLTFGSHQSGLPTTGVVQELAEAFTAETGIKIDFQITPDDQWRDLLKTKLDSGESYDIMCVDADPLSLKSRINPEQNCVPLSGEEWVSRMDPLVLPGVSIGDTVYGIQFPGTRVSTTIYNKEIFEKLNLSIPKTFAEFQDVCQKILDSGITPIYECCQNGWHQVLPLFETGSWYVQKHDDLYNKLNENEMNISEVTEMLTILNQMKECAEKGYYGDNYLSQSFEGAVDAMGSGQFAMFYHNDEWIDEVVAAYPEMEGKFGLFCFPWADNQSVSVNPTNNAYFINAKSKYIEEAKQFFDFLARPENLQKRLDNGNINSVCWPEIPSNESERSKEYNASLPQGTVMQVGVSYIDPQWMDVGKDIDAMYTGAMTPQEVFDNIAKRRDEQARLQKDPAWN